MTSRGGQQVRLDVSGVSEVPYHDPPVRPYHDPGYGRVLQAEPEPSHWRELLRFALVSFAVVILAWGEAKINLEWLC